MVVKRIFEDDWQGNLSHDKDYPCSSYADIETAIRNLNGVNKTIVELICDNENHLTIGGGNDGRYVCYITKGDQLTSLLQEQQSGSDVEITAGGQLGAYKSEQCVNLNTILSASRYYALYGSPNPSLIWQ